MELQFWGAAQTVTGSMHLLKVNGHHILLDCGMYQGRRKEAFERNNNFPFDPSDIDALIVSHAHIDHIGNIPTLVKKGYRGPIWATSATRDLAAIMLRDSAHIQESDVAYVNKRRVKQGQKPFEPLYTQANAIAALALFQSIEYGRTFSPLPGVQVHYRDAGHLLGSASVTLDLDDHGKQKRLVFSGDIGRTNLPILRDPQPVEGADFIIMESTYGGRYHEPPEEARAELKQMVLEAYQNNGKIIIPSFALGRTQELVYALHVMKDAGELPDVRIYVDSPLAVSATEIFQLHPEAYDQEMQAFIKATNNHNPFGFEGITYVRDVEESKALNELSQPAIIISASGMAESGRVLHHLKHNISDPRNMILFVGYQAENTLGRKILDGQPVVSIFGEEYAVRAKVFKINGYSAHADHNGLLAWLKMAQERGHPRQLFLVHGEMEGATTLAEAARQQGIPEVHIPARGQTFAL
ncbi:MAG: MBL fold metallo-hydrolase [Anaerolineales bacterium]|nr:MBL fold metallo-hydrolase [Anaerolineales bacterium]